MKLGKDGTIYYLFSNSQINGYTKDFTIEPPHPVYTNGQNKAIVQLNAITIGGNGLNA